jgi:ArsR family transcriptional regulator
MKKPTLIEVYNCLCDETRLRIIHLLAQSPLCVCHIHDVLGLTQVAASKHLGYLRKRGLVEAKRHEQWMIYSLPATKSRELDWQLRCLQDCLPTHPVFRDDLRRLAKRRSDCDWVTEIVPHPTSATHARTQASVRASHNSNP